MHLHTEDDMYYVRNYSIWLDLWILVRTLWVVLLGRGATKLYAMFPLPNVIRLEAAARSSLEEFLIQSGTHAA